MALQLAAGHVASVGLTLDDVEVWWRRRHSVIHSLAGPRRVERNERAVVRVTRDGRVGVAEVPDPLATDWSSAFKKAQSKLAGTGDLPEAPAARRPPPMTFDLDLVNALSGQPGIGRLASAISENTRHESERISGLTDLGGFVRLDVERVVVARRPGAVSGLTAALTTEVALNGVYGERQRQLHAPESFLPLALLGARTWRTMPREQVTPAGLKLPDGIVLHPRVLERLLRAFIEHFLTEEARALGRFDAMDGETIADRSVTVIDDPGLDGLVRSRGFDDEGMPSVRRALLIHGRLSDLLRSRQDGRASGCQRREGAGVLRPSTSSLLMERGTMGFHDMVDGIEQTAMVQDLGPITVRDDGRFHAPVRWGISLERARRSRLLAPGRWQLSGRLFGAAQPGLLNGIMLSRELVDTGSAILPYGICRLTLGA